MENLETNKGEVMDLTSQEKDEIQLLNREIVGQKLQYADVQVNVDQLEAQLAELRQKKASMLASLMSANQKMYDRVLLALKIRKQDYDSPNGKRWNFNPDTMQFVEVLPSTGANATAPAGEAPKQLQ